jgi:transposase
MWTVEQRRRYERTGLRYPSDLTDAEWALAAPLIPPARRAPAHGGPARGAQRDLLRPGHGLPVAGAAQGPAAAEHGARLPPALGVGRHAGPPPPRALRPGPRAGRQRGQSDGGDPRQPERQGRRKRGRRVDPTGYDTGKKVEGCKRHILVDTLGLLLSACIHPADGQDRDGGLLVLEGARRLFPFIARVFADGGYRGPATAAAVRALGRWELEIVKRSDGVGGFEPLPKRGLVGRTFSWLNRCRRLAKDVENLARTALAFLRLAMIRLMLRRLTRSSAAS